MKKLITLCAVVVLMFAADTNSEINKKLDLLIQKVNTLEKKVDSQGREIDMLKKALNQQKKIIKKKTYETQTQLALKSCNRLKVLSFSYTYHPDVINYYTLKVTLKNNYPYAVKFVRGSLYFNDRPSHTTLLQDYISRDVYLKPGKSITITKKHIISGALEDELKDESKKDVKVYFEPTELIFSNGQKLECD